MAEQPALRRLFVLRHAQAGPSRDDEDDHARPLSEDGIASLTGLRRFLTPRAAGVGVVWCSSAVRTRQTLEGIRAALDPDVTVHVEDDLYRANVAAWLDRCRATPAATRGVLLVGHNPAIARLLHDLTGSGEPEALALLGRGVRPGTLAEFAYDDTWDSLAPGRAHLVAAITPA